MNTIVARIDALETALADKSFPRLAPWWRSTIERFYRSNKRQLVLRVGRRGGKSSTLCRIAVLEALCGDHNVTAGDVGIVGIVSVSRDEAASRLRTIRSILDALGVKYRERDQSIELVDRPIVFKVYTATIAGVVGGTWICAICDEVCRWRDSDSGANPASQVLASLRPCLATMPNAKIFLSSSPLGLEDAHAKAFEQGETEFQSTAHAPTWEANPSLSEAATRALEPHEPTWRREFAAIPQAGACGAFDPRDIDRAIRQLSEVGAPRGRSVGVMDWAGGGGDSEADAIVCWHDRLIADPDDEWIWDPPTPGFGSFIIFRDGKPVTPRLDENGRPVRNPKFESRPLLVVRNIQSVDGKFRNTISAEEIVARVAYSARRFGAHHVCGDQHSAFFLEGSFARQHRLVYKQCTWTNESKIQAVATVRRWFRDGAIVIEPGHEAEKLRRELLNFEERVTSSGAISYGARRASHDDRVALLLTAAMAEQQGILLGGPYGELRSKHETSRDARGAL